MIDPHSIVVRTGELVTAPLGEELAMMDMVSGTYFVLDRVAAVIWESIEKPVAVRTLCEQLVERFDVPEERCQAEIIPFLEKLAQKNLLRVAPGAP